MVKLLQIELNNDKSEFRAIYEKQLDDLRTEMHNLNREKCNEILEKNKLIEMYNLYSS